MRAVYRGTSELLLQNLSLPPPRICIPRRGERGQKLIAYLRGRQ